MPLSNKQIRFCEEYLVDSNSTQAAIRAGYSEKTAYSIGSENLKKPEIADYLKILKEKQTERTFISADKVLREAAKLSFSDIRDYYNEDGSLKNITDLSDDAAAALAGVEVDEIFEWIDGNKKHVGYSKKIKLYNKLDGIEKLMKHLNLYEKDRNAAAANITVPAPIVYNTAPPLPSNE